MTREEAAEILDDYDVNFDGHTAEEIAEAFDVAFKALEEPKQGEWISVEDKLPEDGRPVLIYAWNVHHVIARYDEFRTENGLKKKWVTADAWNGNTEIKHDVIAWMPLPQPMKAEGE